MSVAFIKQVLLLILYEMYPNVVAPPVKSILKKVIFGAAKKNVPCPVPKVLKEAFEFNKFNLDLIGSDLLKRALLKRCLG